MSNDLVSEKNHRLKQVVLLNPEFFTISVHWWRKQIHQFLRRPRGFLFISTFPLDVFSKGSSPFRCSSRSQNICLINSIFVVASHIPGCQSRSSYLHIHHEKSISDHNLKKILFQFANGAFLTLLLFLSKNQQLIQFFSEFECTTKGIKRASNFFPVCCFYIVTCTLYVQSMHNENGQEKKLSCKSERPPFKLSQHPQEYEGFYTVSNEQETDILSYVPCIIKFSSENPTVK